MEPRKSGARMGTTVRRRWPNIVARALAVAVGWLLIVLTVQASPAFAVPPSNDGLRQRTSDHATAGTVSGNKAEATRELSEPSYGADAAGQSAWYRWSAPGTGTVTFDTTGSSYMPDIAVYTGSTVTFWYGRQWRLWYCHVCATRSARRGALRRPSVIDVGPANWRSDGRRTVAHPRTGARSARLSRASA